MTKNGHLVLGSQKFSAVVEPRLVFSLVLMARLHSYESLTEPSSCYYSMFWWHDRHRWQLSRILDLKQYSSKYFEMKDRYTSINLLCSRCIPTQNGYYITRILLTSFSLQCLLNQIAKVKYPGWSIMEKCHLVPLISRRLGMQFMLLPSSPQHHPELIMSQFCINLKKQILNN